MTRRFLNLSGFVLAGGKSHRMGRAKAELVLGGETMLERQIQVLRAVCRSVAVIGNPQSPSNLDIPGWPDELPGRGPAGGIYTALVHARTEFSLILGCDLPFIGAHFLRFLMRRALDARADVTVPEGCDGRIQPVCAVYRRRALAVVRSSLNADLNKTQDLVHRLRAHIIAWQEISRGGFSPGILANMNTLEDYETAKRIVNGE